MKKQFIYTFFTLCLFGKLCAQAFTPYETYTYSRTYLEPVTYNASNPNSNNNSKQVQSVQYTDGLGRPKQDIAIKATYSGNDMVSTYFYDPVTGRQTKQYLPVTRGTAQGGMQTVSEADINSYYGVANAFAEVKTEDSPLSRPVETAAPGEQWKMENGKTKKVEYLFNSLNEVKQYTAISSDDETVFEPSIRQKFNYSPNVLHKIRSTDEDGNVSLAYKNSMGQTLMTRQENGTEKLDTYYVYNQYGQLVMIIPPKASALNGPDQTTREQLCYIYRYDAKGRLIEKKLPGKGKEHMVYDKADRLVLYQDAKMTAQNKWLITKYDKFGRVLYTGILPDLHNRAYLQNIFGSNVIIEEPSTTGFTRNGLQIYYSLNFSYEMDTVLSVNYYDTYPSGTPAKPAAIPEAVLSSDNLAERSTKTLPTASYVKNISDDNWTKTYYWYDQRGRSIGAQEINHMGGITVTHTELDWAGITKKVETIHQRLPNTPNVTVKERFVYNDRNYLEEHWHQVNSNQEELLAKYTYNELGQVTNKQVGNNLQSIDYHYNIRGWLKDINNINVLGSKLFAYSINYAQRDGLETPNLDFPNYKVQPKYNGNITETSWRAVDVGGQTLYSTPERQGFVYDKANRVVAGFYQLPDNPAAKANSEIIENYDKNGNIINLKRTGSRIKGQVKMIDNLTYTVAGNRLSSVTDAAQNAGGYEGGGGAITYDANGNMTAMADKGITAITYNFLNLVEQIEQTNVSTFYYRADGVKLRKKFVLNNESGANTIFTDYLDGFVYLTNRTLALKQALERQDPATVAAVHARQEEIFTQPEALVGPGDPPLDGTLSLAYFPTSEGYYDYANNRYIYQYKDHLGNVRTSYARNPDTGSAEVLDRNDYYPFGMNMQGYSSAFDSAGGVYNYKYNQKELQETGFYDYGWRQYMPDLGRWFGMDQLSEKFSSASPYAYVTNNPMMFLDPDGRDKAPSSGNWLQDMWNNTTSYSSWSNTGNGSFSGGEVKGGMSHENFTSFYNFLSSGQTGSYTYWTGGAGSTTASYNSSGMDVSMQGVVANKITIKGHQDDNSFGNFLNDAGNFNDFYDSMGSSLASNAGNTRIGTNGRIYFPNTNGRVFYGNQYVRTASWTGYGSKIGQYTGPIGKAINAGKIVYGASQDGWTYGKNAQVATGGVIVGLMGAEAGAIVGAEVGALLFSWTGPGAVIAGVVGGLVGGVWGGMSGEEVGQAIIESRYR